MLFHPKGNEKLKSGHNYQISKFSSFFNAFQGVCMEAFAGCALAVSLQTVLRSLLDPCVKYLVHLIKPSNIGLVKEENAAIVVVPVQETTAVLSLESSLLKHQVCSLSNFCSVRVSAH